MHETKTKRNSKKKLILSLVIGFFVLALALAIAIPNLLETRKLTNEARAQQVLKKLYDAQKAYYTKNGRYADNVPTLIDGNFYQCDEFEERDWKNPNIGGKGYVDIQGYRFDILDWDAGSFKIVANPTDACTGSPVFIVDQTGYLDNNGNFKHVTTG